jgi:hypothetical protein
LLTVPTEILDVAHYVRLKLYSVPSLGGTYIIHCLSQKNSQCSGGWIWLHLQVECTFLLFKTRNSTMFQRLYSPLSSRGTEKGETLLCSAYHTVDRVQSFSYDYDHITVPESFKLILLIPSQKASCHLIFNMPVTVAINAILHL